MEIMAWFRLTRARKSNQRHAVPFKYSRRRLLHAERLEARNLLAGWVANSVNVNGSDPGFSIALDTAGNSYVAGLFSGTMRFGSQTFTSAGQTDLFVSKVDSSGNFVWTKTAGGPINEYGVQIIADDAHLYLIADFQESVQFGSSTLGAPGIRQIVAAKLDMETGAFNWAKAMGNSASAGGLAIDDAGRLTFGGSFSGTGQFGSFQLTSDAEGDAFIARLDSTNGDTTWVRQFDPADPGLGNNVRGLEVDSSGNIFFTNGNELRKFDSDGTEQWIQPIANGEGGRISVSEELGITYVYVQEVDEAERLGPAKYQDLGTHAERIWFRYLDPRYGAAGSYGSAMDSAGNHYVIAGAPDQGFVWKLDRDGNTISLRSTSGATSWARDIAVDSAMNIYTTGSLESANTLFDTGTSFVPVSSPTPGNSMFLLKTTQELGNAFGYAFNDLNNNGVWEFNDLDGNGIWSGNDTGEPALTGASIYSDANGNGQRDSGEATAAVQSNGAYRLAHLLPGSHTLRVSPAAGFAPSPNVAGGVALSVQAGATSFDVDFGANTATIWRNYVSSDVPKKFPSRGFQTADSLLNISDAYTAYGVRVSITLTEPRSVTLISPQGIATSVSLPSGQSSVTVHRNDFNGTSVAGVWRMQLRGSDGAPSCSLTAWSLEILGQTTPPAPPGITVTPTSGLVTSEDVTTASFTVRLNSAPTANVTIGISSSDTTEGTVSVGSLTFTSANWSVPQTVTVTGVNDLIIDGNIAYTIVTAPAVSNDSAYQGRNAADVSVTNQDNDRKGKIKLLADRKGPGGALEQLSSAALQTIATASTRRLAEMGIDVQPLNDVRFMISDLPGRTLGEAENGVIWIDQNAAGWGWFVDATPEEDSEFEAVNQSGPALNRMDLLTTVMHEMAHLLGHDHTEEGLMSETLAIGTRHIDLDADHADLVRDIQQQPSFSHHAPWLGMWLANQLEPLGTRTKRKV
jgi:subtilisin-like proprotein convertase family protein